MTFDTCAFDLKSSYDVSDTDEVVLMWFDELLKNNVFPHNLQLKVCCTSYLMHRLNGAWSWCVWCPTTHIRGWCHVYRDTSAQTRKRDM